MAFYVILDDIYFIDNWLADLVDVFFKIGGWVLYLDEVYKYFLWVWEIKNLYDIYLELCIVFIGFFIVELLKQEVDFSCCVLFYELYGLFFCEYLQLKVGEKYGIIDLKDLLQYYCELVVEIVKCILFFEYFGGYLEYGYYLFFLEGEAFYKERLEQFVRFVIESDFDFIFGYDFWNVWKIYQLFYILVFNVLFKFNVFKLSDKIGVYCNMLV